MSWTQSGDHWRRPIDCHEIMFQSIAAAGQPLGREHWLMAGTLKLTFPSSMPDVEGKLRTAWSALRVRHPDIALELHPNEKQYLPISSAESLASWASSTFHVETIVASADELFSKHLRVASASATCHWVPASNELILVSSHWRWDGRGLLMMLHEFMNVLTATELHQTDSVGTEACRLVPSIDEVMGLTKPLPDSLVQQAKDMLAPMEQGPPSIGLPIVPGGILGSTCRMQAVIPGMITSALRAACRTRHIPLTAALHASIVQETMAYHALSGSTETEYKSWVAFDLRKYCPKPLDGIPHAPSLRLVALPLVVNATADWNLLVTSIQPTYQQSFSPLESDLMSVRVPYVERATAMLTTAPPTTEPNLSNLGIVDEYIQTQYGDFGVEKVWLAVQMLSPQLYVHTWGWKGELFSSICYNEAFYEASFVEQWWRKVEQNLVSNLDLARSF
ncbi:hypothetical protein GQX73_g10286 [Xylaria multiplex]|uniref:Condensation domain-containing protein n=1 Tax=Xylaria multiplex TaxID=323545 RepID=A0A7C8MQU9_9PEZI|nr:hypothetical protein GQX73_g10286 [Xylaria multiplex]